jgi:hypothetical protein
LPAFHESLLRLGFSPVSAKAIAAVCTVPREGEVLAPDCFSSLACTVLQREWGLTHHQAGLLLKPLPVAKIPSPVVPTVELCLESYGLDRRVSRIARQTAEAVVARVRTKYRRALSVVLDWAPDAQKLIVRAAGTDARALSEARKQLACVQDYATFSAVRELHAGVWRELSTRFSRYRDHCRQDSISEHFAEVAVFETDNPEATRLRVFAFQDEALKEVFGILDPLLSTVFAESTVCVPVKAALAWQDNAALVCRQLQQQGTRSMPADGRVRITALGYLLEQAEREFRDEARALETSLVGKFLLWPTALVESMPGPETVLLEVRPLRAHLQADLGTVVVEGATANATAQAERMQQFVRQCIRQGSIKGETSWKSFFPCNQDESEDLRQQGLLSCSVDLFGVLSAEASEVEKFAREHVRQLHHVWKRERFPLLPHFTEEFLHQVFEDFGVGIQWQTRGSDVFYQGPRQLVDDVTERLREQSLVLPSGLGEKLVGRPPDETGEGYRVWKLQSSTSVSKETSDYNMAFAQYVTLLPSGAHPQRIERVENDLVERRYATRRALFQQQGCADEVWVFHGTDPQNAPSVKMKGLVVGGEDGIPISHGAACGRGVYSATGPSTPLQYGQQKLIILCRALKGKCGQNQQGDHDSWTPRGDWIIFRKSDQVCPVFFLFF